MVAQGKKKHEREGKGKPAHKWYSHIDTGAISQGKIRGVPLQDIKVTSRGRGGGGNACKKKEGITRLERRGGGHT